MRTDTAIRLDVIAELTSDPSVRHEDIAVAVMGGVVTLAGHVDSYAQRYAGSRAVGRVRGVCAVVNDLTVKLPSLLVGPTPTSRMPPSNPCAGIANCRRAACASKSRIPG